MRIHINNIKHWHRHHGQNTASSVTNAPSSPPSATLSINGTLEDEARVAGTARQRGRAEWARGTKGVGPVWQRRLRPIPGRLLRAHVTAGHKGVCGGTCVHVEGGLATQPQGNVRPDRPTERALPTAPGASAGPFLSFPVAFGSLPPVVSAVDVAAG